MPRMSDWKDYIPASGEGRALVEVKGKVGGKMKYRRTKRSRFAALRRGAFRKKPQVWIPLAPGPQGNTSNRPDMVDYRFSTPGSIAEQSPDQGWLFAITPELSGSATPNAQIASVLGLGGQIDPDQAYRVVGIKGSLHWTPLVSLADPPGSAVPEGLFGFLKLYWYKLKASLDGSADFSGGPLEYPWSGGWDDTANTSGNHVDGFLPWTKAHSVLTVANLRNRDPRYRMDVIHHCKVPWTLEYRPVYDSGTDNILLQPIGQYPIRLPLPRKLVCNIGRGEALACAYQVTSESGSNAASSPAGIFNFEDLRFMVHELD